MRFLLVCILFSLPSALLAESRILAIGDSVMAFHSWTARAIPSVVEEKLGQSVDIEAIPGAQFSHPGGFLGNLGFDIRKQYKPGDWDFVLVNGGANDLLNTCGCKACWRTVQQMISSDLTGEVPDFIKEVLAQGARVIWMGYYASARAGQFSGCRDYIVEMEDRVRRFADQTSGLSFVDTEDVIDRNNEAHFAFDGIHPSPLGSRLIGQKLAEHILTFE